MNSKFSASLILSAVVSVATLHAQDERRPEPPPGFNPGAAGAGPERRPLPPPDFRGRTPGEPPGRGDRGPREHGFGEGRDFRGPDPDRRRDEGGQGGPGRRFDDSRQGDRVQFREQTERDVKPTPYLGVITSPVAPVLSAQLGTPEGFGRVVDDVLPESPAKTAGVERHDVLLFLNDQQLASSDQFASLIRSLGTGAEAALTVVRKGQQQKLPVKISESRRPLFSIKLNDRVQRAERGRRGGDVDQRIRDHQESLRKHHQKLEEWQKNPVGTPPPPPPLPETPGQPQSPTTPEPGPGQSHVRPADILRDLGPGGGSRVRSEWAEGESRWASSQARVMMRDETGEIAIAVNDGKRTLTVKNPKGETVFTGPVDTEDQRNAVPDPFRGKLGNFRPPPAGDVHRTGPDRSRDGERRERFERRFEVQ
jgi:serine protease Do